MKFDFGGRVWLTFTWVIALCKNSVFRTFLFHLSTYWVEISYMNLSWRNTGQVRLWSHLTYFYMSYCPLLKFRFPVFSLSSFDILTWNSIWGMNLYSHNTGNFSLLYPFIYSFWSYASLKFVGTGRGHVLLQQYLQYACSNRMSKNSSRLAMLVWISKYLYTAVA